MQTRLKCSVILLTITQTKHILDERFSALMEVTMPHIFIVIWHCCVPPEVEDIFNLFVLFRFDCEHVLHIRNTL